MTGGAGFDEPELLRRCRDGSTSAWDEFIRHYTGTVLGAVRQTLLRCHRPSLAQDVENVVQEVFASLLEDSGRKLKTFSGRCPIENWLRAVAIRRALNYVRSEKLRQGQSLEDHPLFIPGAPAEEAEAIRSLKVEKLQEYLKELSPRDRLVLKMFYLDGVPQKQIARTLGVSENTIGPLLARARQRAQRKTKFF